MSSYYRTSSTSNIVNTPGRRYRGSSSSQGEASQSGGSNGQSTPPLPAATIAYYHFTLLSPYGIDIYMDILDKSQYISCVKVVLSSQGVPRRYQGAKLRQCRGARYRAACQRGGHRGAQAIRGEILQPFLMSLVSLERNGLLKCDDPFHMSSLHRSYIPRLSSQIETWRAKWNTTVASTTRKRDPHKEPSFDDPKLSSIAPRTSADLLTAPSEATVRSAYTEHRYRGSRHAATQAWADKLHQQPYVRAITLDGTWPSIAASGLPRPQSVVCHKSGELVLEEYTLGLSDASSSSSPGSTSNNSSRGSMWYTSSRKQYNTTTTTTTNNTPGKVREWGSPFSSSASSSPSDTTGCGSDDSFQEKQKRHLISAQRGFLDDRLLSREIAIARQAPNWRKFVDWGESLEQRKRRMNLVVSAMQHVDMQTLNGKARYFQGPFFQYQPPSWRDDDDGHDIYR